jgi:hypothetical protein
MGNFSRSARRVGITALTITLCSALAMCTGGGDQANTDTGAPGTAAPAAGTQSPAAGSAAGTAGAGVGTDTSRAGAGATGTDTGARRDTGTTRRP